MKHTNKKMAFLRCNLTFLLIAFLLSACSRVEPNNGITENTTPADYDESAAIPLHTAPENEATETPPQKDDSMQPFHGTWEGTIGEPFNYRITLNCHSDFSKKKVLISLDDEYLTNFYYLRVNWRLDESELRTWWNDGENRTVMVFSLNDDGTMTGTYSQYDETSSGEFTKTSDTPEEGDFHYKPHEKYISLLMENSQYDREDNVPVDFEYFYDSPALEELRNTYHLTEVAGTGDTQSQAVNLLKWLAKGTTHNGNTDGSVDKNALSLLEYAYNQEPENGINCYCLSIILSEMCLSVGIQARALWLMPENPNDMDNHVVVMAYIPERQKWILLDPSFNAYFYTEEDGILSPWEIREKLSNQEEIKINDDAKINYTYYAGYMAKDMFYFKCMQKTGFGIYGQFPGGTGMPISDNNEIYLCPNSFDLVEWKKLNLRYRNENYLDGAMNEEDLIKSEQAIQEKQYIFATPEDFWRS